MKPAIVYVRVSKESGRPSLGIKAQEDAVQRFVDANGLSVVGVFREVETGKGFDALDRRPQLAAALALAKKLSTKANRVPIVVAKLDRLSRDVEFIAHLMNQKTPFVCVEHPDAPAFMLHIYAAVAQEERRKIAERTSQALQAAKRRGVKLGSPVVGDRRRKEAEENAERLRDVVVPLRARNLSLRQIAATLNEKGCVNPSGGPWHDTTVGRVLKRLAAAR